jgi:diguanylate cyclase (GGDEF)-like protein
MIIRARPANEQARLNILHSLDIADSVPEERYDRLTRLARRLFDVPIALVSLLDAEQHHIKSAVGLESDDSTTHGMSFSGHTLLQDDVFTVPDTTQDERFRNDPMVTDIPFIRFYAGCPLTLSDGSKLGTLCLFDRRPRHFDEQELTLLRDLGRTAAQEIAAARRSTVDELTGLSNRRGFEALAQHALNLSRRLERPACMFCFDLDDFKRINIHYGRAEGDRALVAFGRLLLEQFRDSDVVGRLGEDDFAVLLTNTVTADTTATLTRFRHAVTQHNLESNLPYSLNYSLGAVEYDAEMHHSIGELLQEADTLLYRNKQLMKKN